MEIKIDGLQLEPAGLDLGKVEHVVDDGQQRLAAEEQGVDKVLLVDVERGAEEEMSHADDAVERSADLVAHVGEERTLGLVGGDGGFLGGGEFGGAGLDAAFELDVELAELFFAGGEFGGAGVDQFFQAGFFAPFEERGKPGGE